MTQKEIEKFLDNTKVYINGKSEEIQKKLFSFSFHWFGRKENDDEKIKTAILNHLKKMWGNCQDDVCGVHVEDAIAWLEKQGEQEELHVYETKDGEIIWLDNYIF